MIYYKVVNSYLYSIVVYKDRILYKLNEWVTPVNKEKTPLFVFDNLDVAEETYGGCYSRIFECEIKQECLDKHEYFMDKMKDSNVIFASAVKLTKEIL